VAEDFEGKDKYIGAEPLIEAIDGVSRLIVLSPHLDDAVLSCGALMNHARKETSITAVTFFTEGAEPPYTYSARRYLHQTQDRHANSLFLARRAEDQAVLEGAGISYVHVGLTEILFRRRTRPLLNGLPWASRLIPELSYLYPTYRLHVIRGGILPDDVSTIRRIREIIDHLSPTSSTLFLAPLAVGGHKDHMLVRTAAELSRQRVAYYSDFPYNTRYSVDPSFVQRNSLVQATWSHDLTAKLPLIRAYRTQVDSLFPGGEIPIVPEVYLLPGQQQSS
jgi:LmbE family N-acetylglucosaminyl deacetylase